MGFFGKIKNILFEEDDEEEDMPVYTKENVKKDDVSNETLVEPTPNQAVELDEVRYTSIKRDVDTNFEDTTNSLEITNTLDIPRAKLENKIETPPPNEEKKSPFLSFDEDEFERLNSRININEKKIKKPEKNIAIEQPKIETKVDVRKANNNFSSVSTFEKANQDKDRYKIKKDESESRKPFTPSPVISPVYGILNKNYRKDEIVDKKDGIKREKLVKDVHHAKTVEVARKDEYGVYTVDIDSVRKKAFGGLDNLEKNANLDRLRNEEEQETKSNESTLVEIDEIVKDLPKENKKLSVEDELDQNDYNLNTSDSKDNDVVDYSSLSKKEEPLKNEKPKALDELEKTSTLQILDDIEKELNSIKPISNNSDDLDNNSDEARDPISNSDTLENDLFNLIDSMYEKDGEEEDDA